MSSIENPIDVFMIWGAERDAIDAPYLIDSWDEWQIDGNCDGWKEAIVKAEKGNELVRITQTTVSCTAITATFAPTSIENNGIKENK